MLRYADRRAAAASGTNLSVPRASALYPRQDTRLAPPTLHANYSQGDDGEDDDTAIGTDLSALPPVHQHVRAKFNADPVCSETYFDKDAPPDAVEHAPPVRAASATLGVPSFNRPRATSLDSRKTRPQPPAGYSYYPSPTPVYAAPSQPHYSRPPPPSFQHSQAYNTHSPQQEYRRQQAEDEDSEDDQEGQSGDDNSDDDDAFTAVSSGVAEDISEEEQQAALAGAHLQTYGRSEHQHQRAVSTLENYGLQSNMRFPQEPPQDERRAANLPAYRQDRNSRDEASRRLPPPPFATNRRRSPSSSPLPASADTRRAPSPLSASPAQPTLAPPKEIVRPSSAGSLRPDPTPVASYISVPRSAPLVPEDSPEEKNLIRLLRDMNFSVALKDFHDTFGLGVRKTIVAADGYGHAFCKIHCTKLPRHSDLSREPHLAQHWVPLAGNRWYFKTSSHKVEVVFKSVGLGTFEATTARYKK